MSFPRNAFIKQSEENYHSEEFIHSSLNYIDNLEKKGFPVIFSLPHLAMEIGMQSDFIKKIIDYRMGHYSFFKLQKRDKTKNPREIMAPTEELKYIQRWINYNILQKNNFQQCVKGFIPGTSIYLNAKVHENAKYLLKIDLLKFFDCITQKKVYDLFCQFGYVKNLSWSLAMLCTCQHRDSYWESFSSDEKKKFESIISQKMAVIPQGAPTSPLISNLVTVNMDKRLIELSNKQKFNYTRYADDMCFSAESKDCIPSIKFIKEIIEEEGFFINEKKTKYSKKGMKQYVTGLSITHTVSVNKSRRKEIFKHLYFAHKYGPFSHLNHLEKKGINKSNFQNWLLGHISFNYSINKQIGKKMFDIYSKIDWSIDPENDE